MDKMTKVLLATIAIGLLLNALNPWLKPAKVKAEVLQSDYFLQSIDSNLSIIRSDLSSIETEVERISHGNCKGPICD